MNFETTNAEFRSRWQEFTAKAQPPEWVRKMIEHYWKTGEYRPEDLQKLLGDPTKSVEAGPKASLLSLFHAKKPIA